MKLIEARFVTSAVDADGIPKDGIPHVALVGRSNVGKSSLLNALAKRGVARISAAPGKTRLANLYRLQVEGGPGGSGQPGGPGRWSVYLADLPGYGYARASHAERQAFRRLVTGALARPRLTGVLWLLDSRREPSTDDRAIQELLAGRETRVLAALTKSDKVPRGLRPTRERELRDALALDADQVIVTSARAGEGIADLRESIGRLASQAG